MVEGSIVHFKHSTTLLIYIWPTLNSDSLCKHIPLCMLNFFFLLSQNYGSFLESSSVACCTMCSSYLFWQMGERRDKAIKELRDQLAAKQQCGAVGAEKQNIWKPLVSRL